MIVDIVERIREVGLVPVVRAASAEEAFAAVEAIRAGGIPILEMTLTVPGAVEIIRDLTRRLGDDALIGAGTGRILSRLRWVSRRSGRRQGIKRPGARARPALHPRATRSPARRGAAVHHGPAGRTRHGTR